MIWVGVESRRTRRSTGDCRVRYLLDWVARQPIGVRSQVQVQTVGLSTTKAGSGGRERNAPPQLDLQETCAAGIVAVQEVPVRNPDRLEPDTTGSTEAELEATGLAIPPNHRLRQSKLVLQNVFAIAERFVHVGPQLLQIPNLLRSDFRFGLHRGVIDFRETGRKTTRRRQVRNSQHSHYRAGRPAQSAPAGSRVTTGTTGTPGTTGRVRHAPETGTPAAAKPVFDRAGRNPRGGNVSQRPICGAFRCAADRRDPGDRLPPAGARSAVIVQRTVDHEPGPRSRACNS